MFNKFRGFLKTSIGLNQTNNEEDILKTRKNFLEIGLKAGRNDDVLLDTSLDTAIRNFQKAKGLKLDGIMKPGGETERSLIAETLRENHKNSAQSKKPSNKSITFEDIEEADHIARHAFITFKEKTKALSKENKDLNDAINIGKSRGEKYGSIFGSFIGSVTGNKLFKRPREGAKIGRMLGKDYGDNVSTGGHIFIEEADDILHGRKSRYVLSKEAKEAENDFIKKQNELHEMQKELGKQIKKQ